jgi:PAS domain S-box-containing protein
MRTRVRGFALAVLAVAAAALLRILLEPLLLGRVAFLPFFPAVILAVWAGGPGPGALAVVLAALIATFDRTGLPAAASAPPPDWFAFGARLAIGAMTVWAIHTLRRGRRRAEDERRYTAEILEKVGAGFCTVSRDGRLVSINPEAEKILGRSAADLAGRDARELLPAEDPSASFLTRALAGETVEFEVRNRPSDRWFSVRAFPSRHGAAVFLLDTTGQRRAEQARVEASERLEEALAAAGMGYWSWDLETGRVEWSDALAEIHGLPAGEFDGRFETFRSLIHPEDRDRVLADIEGALRSQQGYNAEFRVVRPDGTVRWIGARGRAKVVDGRTVGMIGFAMDLTDRRSAEEGRQHLAAIVDSTQDGILSVGLDGRILSWNQAAEEILGYRAEEIVGRSIEVLIPPDRTEDFHGALRRIQAGERIEHYETKRRRKDGRLVDVHLTVSPIRDSDGRLIAVSKVARDIGAQKAGEAARQHLAAIVDSSQDGIISAGLDGRILSWNEAAEHIFGYTPDEVVGRSIETLIPPDRAEDFIGVVRRIQEGERIEHYETHRRRKDGTLVEVFLTVSPIRDPGGRLVGVSKIVKDVTAQKAAERERERTRELFLATLGHDLRNPLNTIVASAYLLQRQVEEKSARSVARILQSGERMARMIHQLLDFTRARLGGGIPVQGAETDLQAICVAALEELEAQHANRFRFRSEGDARGSWDADRLAQVFSNLLGNAVDHGDPTSPIEVSLRRRGDAILFEVTNAGPPIPESLRAVLFDPFRRGAQELHSRQKGLGLGLYISREIVRAHGGSIDVESDAEKTTFRVVLPAPAQTRERTAGS